MTDEEQIATWIRAHGVTRLPPAICAETTGRLPDEAVAWHRSRGVDPVGEGWRKRVNHGWAVYWKRKRLLAAQKRAQE
jgi:hypothetical protein